MYSMFAYTTLKFLDLSSFDFHCNITNIIGGTRLKEIKIKKIMKLKINYMNLLRIAMVK